MGFPPEEVVAGVSPATSMLDEPADAVGVDVAAPPSAASQAKSTAGTPIGPSKKQFWYWRSPPTMFAHEASLYKTNLALPELQMRKSFD